MKKITLISACMLLFTSVSAEQMQFVTTMSAPVGNFARLDAADSTHVTSAPILNFCNTRSSVGDIIIKGASAYLNQVNIQNGTTLGSTNTPEYRLGENLSIENGGTVTAGRVMANDVIFKDTNFHKSNVTDTIYGDDVAVMGGKTDNMDISGTAKINKSAQDSANLGEELWWDNQYSGDYDSSGNKKTNGKTYTSFLLKSKSSITPTDPDEEGDCDPNEEPEDLSIYDKDCNTCGKDIAYAECNTSTRKWEIKYSGCDVEDPDKECYEYTWEPDYKKSCVYNSGSYYSDVFKMWESCNYNSRPSISCFVGEGNYESVGCGGHYTIYDVVHGCSKVMRTAEFLYEVPVEAFADDITPYGSVSSWNKKCTYAQEGHIGYSYSVAGASGSGVGDMNAEHYCWAFVCTRGKAKSN